MISVSLVDDHKLLRSGLSNFIKSTPKFQVLFEADNGLELQEKLNPRQLPDIVLMDINMPVLDGYASTLWLHNHYPSIKVIALSMYDEEKCIIRMLRCGAKGYLLKDTEPAELIKALEEVQQSGYYYSPLVYRHVIQLMQSPDPIIEEVNLTERETDLLRLMATEMTYKEIAEAMFLSHKTVEGHRERMCDKLQIKTRVGMVIYAIKNGIIQV